MCFPVIDTAKVIFLPAPECGEISIPWGATRNVVIVAPKDAASLGLRDGMETSGVGCSC